MELEGACVLCMRAYAYGVSRASSVAFLCLCRVAFVGCWLLFMPSRDGIPLNASSSCECSIPEQARTRAKKGFEEQ